MSSRRPSCPITITLTITTTATITTTRTSEAGRLQLLVERRGERSTLVRAEGHVPYAARIAPFESLSVWTRVVLVQTIAGPLAGDRVTIDVGVGAGAALELVGNAATLAYPSSCPARHELRIRLGAGARFAWLPQPLILAAGCNLEASVELQLEADAAALTREIVVLGRYGEPPGRYRSRLRCEIEGRPLLHEVVEIDPEGVAQSSAAVLAGAGAFASLGLFGLAPAQTCGTAELALAGPGRVARALAADTASLRVKLAPIETVYRETLTRDQLRVSRRSEGGRSRQRADGQERGETA